MDEQTQKIIAEQMKKLPKDVVQAIISVDYKTKLQEITKRQRLLIDQAGKLEMETTLVMIGLEPLADFVANIEREMGLNTIRAKEVAMDVSENIFKPIRESLQKMNEEMGNEDEVNETDLNRDQILDEIENPVPNNPTKITPTTEVEIRPKQEINIYENKMTGVTVTPQQVVTAKPESKLPEVTKRPYNSSNDPYREPLS